MVYERHIGCKASRALQSNFGGRTKWLDTKQNSGESDECSGENFSTVYRVGKISTCPIRVELEVEGQPFMMKVDTGAALSLISECQLQQVLPRAKPKRTSAVLRTYISEQIPVVGEVRVTVQYSTQHKQLTLYVIKGEGPCLIGREWLRIICLDWKVIGMIAVDQSSTRLSTLLDTNSEIFKDKLETMEGIQAKLTLREGATPRFHRPRPVPLYSKEYRRVRTEEAGGSSGRSTEVIGQCPLSLFQKRMEVRVCGDYKFTVNQALSVDQCPLPKPEDLFATLANGKTFTKLDVLQAYQQMLLDGESIKHIRSSPYHPVFYETL